MKNVFLISIAAVFMITLASGLALATTTTFLDQTLVQQSNTGQWLDIVGDANHYDIKQTSVTWNGTDVTIAIHTNDPGTPAFSGDYIADLGIDKNRDGVWESGIVLKTDARRDSSFTAGTVFTLAGASNNSHWYVTNDPPFNYGGYGSKYDRNNNPNPGGSHSPADIPVLLRSGYSYSTFAGSVSWVADPDLIANYLVTITLTGVNGDGSWNHFDFLWGGETCGNDTQFDHANVPLPGSLLLLGTGLLGLAGATWRRRQL